MQHYSYLLVFYFIYIYQYPTIIKTHGKTDSSYIRRDCSSVIKIVHRYNIVVVSYMLGCIHGILWVDKLAAMPTHRAAFDSRIKYRLYIMRNLHKKQ